MNEKTKIEAPAIRVGYKNYYGNVWLLARNLWRIRERSRPHLTHISFCGWAPAEPSGSGCSIPETNQAKWIRSNWFRSMTNATYRRLTEKKTLNRKSNSINLSFSILSVLIKQSKRTEEFFNEMIWFSSIGCCCRSWWWRALGECRSNGGRRTPVERCMGEGRCGRCEWIQHVLEGFARALMRRTRNIELMQTKPEIWKAKQRPDKINIENGFFLFLSSRRKALIPHAGNDRVRWLAFRNNSKR